jgi:hypothetical protein
MRSPKKPEPVEIKSRNLQVDITPSEYARLQDRFRSTTYRVFAEFIRSLLRSEPMIKRYRNQSLDEILEVLVEIKNAVETAVHSLDDAIARIIGLPRQTVSVQDLASLLKEQYTVKAQLEQIKGLLIKIYEKCGPVEGI